MGPTQDSGGLQAGEALHGRNGLGQLLLHLQLPGGRVCGGQVAEPAQPLLGREQSEGWSGGRASPSPLSISPGDPSALPRSCQEGLLPTGGPSERWGELELWPTPQLLGPPAQSLWGSKCLGDA